MTLFANIMVSVQPFQLIMSKVHSISLFSAKKQKIPQVVGHYVGRGKLSDIPDEIINSNNYEPVPGWGENGRPVAIPSKDVFKMQQLFQINQFNLLVSDGISLNRSLPDVRNSFCKEHEYPIDLPTTSVVIVFYNEAWSVLLRTVWSIINRSSHQLVKEIILVDDGSDRAYLLDELDTYIKSINFPVRVLRLGERKGLVPARLLGAQHATGDVLTFLDAHCECSEGWLPPLLSRIKENRRKVVCPVIDIISDDNFGYVKSAEFHWGAFNWQLHFRWYQISDKEIERRRKDPAKPFRTPAMAGGLFSIDRGYFNELGSYDSEMKIWGGENLEMSIRVWQCGGEIEIAPCSHVGHLFRKSSPYTFPGGINDILDKNLIRVASVWMDEWSDLFYNFNKNAALLRDNTDVNDRIELRRKLRCHSFEWYLRTVWPEHFFPMHDRFFGRIQIVGSRPTHNFQTLVHQLANKRFYSSLSPEGKLDALITLLNERHFELEPMLQHVNPALCFRKPKSNNTLHQPFGELTLAPCSYGADLIAEMFVLTPDGRIMTDDNMCLQAPTIEESSRNSLFMKRARKKVKVTQCSGSTALQKWSFNVGTLQFVHSGTEYCLEADSTGIKVLDDLNAVKDADKMNIFVYLRECDTLSRLQKWVFLPVAWSGEIG